jgi:hypothetical protein
MKLGFKFAKPQFEGSVVMARSKLLNFSGPFSHMHSSRLYEIPITRAFTRALQIAPTLHITPVPVSYG